MVLYSFNARLDNFDLKQFSNNLGPFVDNVHQSSKCPAVHKSQRGN